MTGGNRTNRATCGTGTRLVLSEFITMVPRFLSAICERDIGSRDRQVCEGFSRVYCTMELESGASELRAIRSREMHILGGFPRVFRTLKRDSAASAF